MLNTRALVFRGLLATVLFAAQAPAAIAAADFFGVKMKSEDFAQDVYLLEDVKVPEFTSRPGTDKRVYAYGYMSTVLGGGRGIALEVFNHSEEPLATQKLFRELSIVTWDGRRYDRSEPEMMWARDVLKSGESATFNFTFPGIRVEKEEVRMVVCSFDLGETLIVLLPLQAREAPKSAAKKPGKLFGLFEWWGQAEVPATEPEKKAAVPDKQVPPDYPLVKPEQVLEGVHYHFTPGFRKEVREAQKVTEGIVYKNRPWSLDNPDQLFTHPEEVRYPSEGFPRRQASVLVVSQDYGFVVVDAGYENGFGKSLILDVLRNGRRIGKVLVTKPRDKIAGAVILPEWRTQEEIRVGDIVGVSS